MARFSSNDSSRSSVIESDWVRRFGAERVAEMRSLLVELTSVSPEPLAAAVSLRCRGLAARELAVEGEGNVVGRLCARQLAEVGRVEDEQERRAGAGVEYH